MWYNQWNKKIKGKLSDNLQDRILKGRVTISWPDGNTIASQWWYVLPWKFLKVFYNDMFGLTDDCFGKFIRLCQNMDRENNRIDLLFYGDQIFEWKTRQAKYKFVKQLKDNNLIKKIDWHWYINPYCVNSRGKIEKGGKQDELLKHFN